MRIEVAEHAGFCFGVKRAVDTVYQEVEKADGQKIYTYGPVVHNEEVVRDLEEKGVTVEVESIGGGQDIQSTLKGYKLAGNYSIEIYFPPAEKPEDTENYICIPLIKE